MIVRPANLLVLVGMIGGTVYATTLAANIQSEESTPVKYYCMHNTEIYAEVYDDQICPQYIHNGPGEEVHPKDESCILSRLHSWMIDQRP